MNPNNPRLNFCFLRSSVVLIVFIFCLSILSSCEPTYPVKTLPSQLVKLVKEEQGLDISSQIIGKTLWVYLPLTDLVEDKKTLWKPEGLEKIGKVISKMQRTTLSTDTKLNFLVLVAADIRQYGIELVSMEYVPDIQEAMLERFSRGEFLLRNVRDVNVNPKAIGDLSGKSQKFYDVPFEQFLSLQIINRVKILFTKDKQLSSIFEIKSSNWSSKFGIIKLEFEFLKKRYNLSLSEQAIDPLHYVKMTTALVIKAYDYKKIQAVELTNTFSQKTLKASLSELQKLKIKLPEILD